MERIRLVHWNVDEAKIRAKKLRDAGYHVDCDVLSPVVMRDMKKKPPTTVIIDLGRLPMQGRDLGLAIRHFKTTRHIPIIFVGGDPEKVKRTMEHLPDAVYTSWSRIRSTLKAAIANPPNNPVVPKSILAGYSGTPLVKKLGIKPYAVVALIDTPNDFEKSLGELPEGVKWLKNISGKRDLTIMFSMSRKDVERRIHGIVTQINKGGLWIVWPKKTSGVSTDLSETVVRRIGLNSELVDYKICSIDITWSGLLFTRRKSIS